MLLHLEMEVWKRNTKKWHFIIWIDCRLCTALPPLTINRVQRNTHYRKFHKQVWMSSHQHLARGSIHRKLGMSYIVPHRIRYYTPSICTENLLTFASICFRGTFRKVVIQQLQSDGHCKVQRNHLLHSMKSLWFWCICPDFDHVIVRTEFVVKLLTKSNGHPQQTEVNQLFQTSALQIYRTKNAFKIRKLAQAIIIVVLVSLAYCCFSHRFVSFHQKNECTR